MENNVLLEIRKRDGRIVSFDQTKITNAVWKAMQVTGIDLGKTLVFSDAVIVANYVVEELGRIYCNGGVPTIENIQDIVEEKLILSDYPKTAKAYIVYRHERAKIRSSKKEVSPDVKKIADESSNYFQGPYEEFIYFGHYSRWMSGENRRETWVETVDRYMAFMFEKLGDRLASKEYEKIQQMILWQKTIPSMRLMWSAGKAARATNVAAYNCAYQAIKNIRDFGEQLYALMCGAGISFSVEENFIQELPKVVKQNGTILPTFKVPDSKEGWAEALNLGIETWMKGGEIDFDFSEIRPRGTRLNTMGGWASGPEPLKGLLKFTRARILNRQGRRLKPIDVHDINCKIGDAVIMGGVRRSAELSLSDLDDSDMRQAKVGRFFELHPERQMANNSVAYNGKPNLPEFLEEWLSLMKSGSGERGIFNREGLKYQLPHRRLLTFGPYFNESGINPCGEIFLRSKQFCNLTEIVARPSDSLEDLMEKIFYATLLGTYQATLTDFPFLSPTWKRNCEEERLLGVSITGQWDSPIVRDAAVLQKLKEEVIRVNRIFAERFGINPSTCATCVKPSGTVSQLVNASSGMHPRYAKYYIRRVEIDAADPLFKMLRDQKVPHRPKYGQPDGHATNYVLEFPVKSPENAITRHDLSALEQLEYWKKVKINYTEHNPSITVYANEDEWLKVGNWIWENWNIIGGLSFLPRDDSIYPQAPYEEITAEEYKQKLEEFPVIDYSQILAYESFDEKGAHELACTAGKCEL
ncbi:ribonucleoside-triphosphate reductase [Candidatus Azambacteria bacterium]|nr:ribonucleoside-triphosphate reductase [Candidatus Azambacteria bacterium]